MNPIQPILINTIPALLWGNPSERLWIYVHGKMADKTAAASFASIAAERGFQTLSFDLPEHGERTAHPERCDIWTGIRDLTTVADYAKRHWKQISLYGCSLGAFFSLHAYSELPLERCLFQSPVVDMEYLIRQMFQWFGITEEQLRQQREIPTPVDTLSYDYYAYIRQHPITRWTVPTAILYGGRDTLQSREIVEGFARRFGCTLTISEESEHPFLAESDAPIVERWLRENIR